MATKPTRLKSAAAPYAPQTKETCQQDIKRIGDLQRDLGRETAAMNDLIAQATEAAAPRLEALQERIKALQTGVQTWCEANREELCGKGKTANLITGEVSWRQRPPSVGIRNIAVVLAHMKRYGLTSYVRIKEEINKDAILASPEAVRGVVGITINAGMEDFIITPFEVQGEKA
jgi:phage host-nuclease inhibitor protein Gam